MPKKDLIPICLVLFLILTACRSRAGNQAPLATPLPLPSPARDWNIKMTQSGGIAGVSLSVEVSSRGQLTAQDLRSGKSATVTLSEADLAQLSRLVDQIQTPPAAMPPSKCADCFIYTLELQLQGRDVTLQVDDTTLQGSGLSGLIGFLHKLRDNALSVQP